MGNINFIKSFGQILVGVAVVVLLTLIADAFTQPTQAPPGGNVVSPLNTSGTAQIKTGNLTFPLFYDYNNTGYYADPDANSIFYRIYGMADIRAPIFYDQNNTSYFVDPAGTSRLNSVAPDSINLGGVSRSSWPEGIPPGMIAMFDTSCPSGWTRFSALDERFPRGSSSYGGTGGSISHNHTVTVDGELGSGGCNICGRYLVGSDGTYQTSSAGDLPPYLNVVFCKKN